MIGILKFSKMFSFISKANSQCLANSSRGLASLNELFGKEKTPTKENQIQNENLIATDFEAIKNTETTRLVRVKAYKPASDVEEQIKNLCKESFGNKYNEQNYKDLSLSDRAIKFDLLTKCITNFNHNIPSSILNEINNVKDLLDYYSTELKDTSPLEDIYKQQDLPKNLHINLEYNRFNPETDKFFDGKDAYAERNTKVTSLWYSKKYKSVIKKKPYFTK